MILIKTFGNQKILLRDFKLLLKLWITLKLREKNADRKY